MRTLERIYSRSERIVLRARFSGFAAAKLIIVAAVLGAIIALLWVYAPEIEGGLDPKFDGTVRYLTPANLKWALLGAACFVIFLVICDAVSMYRQELIVTEDKFIFKQGVFKIRSVMLPLAEIRYIDVHQNVFQVICGYGKIRVITDGDAPFIIKNLVRPEKFARKVMKQSSALREQSMHPRLTLSARAK